MRHKFFDKDFIEEEGRQDIYHWSERRERNYKGFRKSVHVFRIFAFNTNLLRSFFENFNLMVILQMALAGLVTYACKSLNIVYDVHVSLFISPIVFPLAFSINTDFQRREKVLEDLALFKSSAMMWLFCMRDWRVACCFDDAYMKAVGNKIKGLLFHLREYLLTEKIDRRKFIARVIYEDLSDANQFNEKVRGSDLNANSPLVSRIVHFLNMMCLAYERLRVIREYRSPRSIRSFTKVLIFVLPLLLSPYYVFLGNKENNNWSPYYISVMVAFVFGALQGVQDKLDDPFDGMSEDDIKLDTLDEWTFQSLEATVHRTYKIGRFQVSSNPENEKETSKETTINMEDVDGLHTKKKNIFHKERPARKDSIIRRNHGTRTPLRSPRSVYSEGDSKGEDLELHPYAGVLQNIKGNTTIHRGGHIKRQQSYDDLNSANNTITKENSKPIPFVQGVFNAKNSSQINLKTLVNTPITDSTPEDCHAACNGRDSDQISFAVCETPLTLSNIAAVNAGFVIDDSPINGVASYLTSIKKHSGAYSHSSSHNSELSNASRSESSNYKQENISSIFSVGNSEQQVPQVIPQSRFHIFNVSSSTDPLINSTCSVDSDTVSSSDDELKKRSHSAKYVNHREPGCSKCRNFSDSGKSLHSSPTNATSLWASQSESGLYHELKDKEIFI